MAAWTERDGYADPDWHRPFLEGTGLHLSFCTEDDAPPRYDDLLHDFAAHSSGTFTPSAVAQNPAEYHEAMPDWLLVQFVHNDRLYQFTAEYKGDWFDIRVVAHAVNRALADSGVPQRFLRLGPPDEVAFFVFVPPTAFAHAARELGWPLIESYPG